MSIYINIFTELYLICIEEFSVFQTDVKLIYKSTLTEVRLAKTTSKIDKSNCNSSFEVY